MCDTFIVWKIFVIKVKHNVKLLSILHPMFNIKQVFHVACAMNSKFVFLYKWIFGTFIYNNVRYLYIMEDFGNKSKI